MGRERINKKLYKKQCYKYQQTLSPEDILGTLNILFKVHFGFDY